MKMAIAGILIGCLGIIVTVIVAMKRSAGIHQDQRNTKDSSQKASIDISEGNRK